MRIKNQNHVAGQVVSSFRTTSRGSVLRPTLGVSSAYRGSPNRPIGVTVQMSEAGAKPSMVSRILKAPLALHYYYFEKLKTTNLVRYFSTFVNTYIAAELISYAFFSHNLKFGAQMVEAFSASGLSMALGLYILSFGIPFIGGMLSRKDPVSDPFAYRGIDDETVDIDRKRVWTAAPSLRESHGYFREKQGFHSLIYNLAWSRFGSKLGWGVAGLTTYLLALAAFSTKTAAGVAMGGFFGSGFGPVLFLALGSLLIPTVRVAIRQMLQNSIGLSVNRPLANWAPSLSTDIFQLTKFNRLLGVGAVGAAIYGATLTLAAPFGLGYGLLGVAGALAIPATLALFGAKNPPPSPYGLLFAAIEKSPKIVGTLAAAGWSWFFTNTFLSTAPKHTAITEWIGAKGPGPAVIAAILFAGPYIFRGLFHRDKKAGVNRVVSLWHIMHNMGKKKMIPMAQGLAGAFGVFGVLERYINPQALFGMPFRSWGFGEALSNAMNQFFGVFGMAGFGLGETAMGVMFSLLVAGAIGDAQRIDRDNRGKRLRPNREAELETLARGPSPDPTLDDASTDSAGLIEIASIYDADRRR